MLSPHPTPKFGQARPPLPIIGLNKKTQFQRVFPTSSRASDKSNQFPHPLVEKIKSLPAKPPQKNIRSPSVPYSNRRKPLLPVCPEDQQPSKFMKN